MRIFRQLNELPKFNKTVLTIGSFDGVHLAHRQIIARVCALAKQIGGESVLITFHPHPRKVINQGDSPGLLSPLSEKIGLLAQAGLQNLVVIPFTPEFSQQSPEQYINDFLYRYFQPKHIVIGYDHRYGKNRAGDLALLQQYGEKLGYEVAEIAQQLIDNIAISSTKIRKALENKDIHTANALLGYKYNLIGTVVKGKQLGRTIGFPTANIALEEPDKLLPPQGVYAVKAIVTEKVYNAMLNIGYCPTVTDNNTNVSIEVHLFDFPPDREIYGETIIILLCEYVRTEQKFDNIEQLTQQINRDKAFIYQKMSEIDMI